MKKSILAALLVAFTFSSLAFAGTIKIPSEDPYCVAKVPDSWKPEETDHGYALNSPDDVATVLLEATSKKGMEKLIDANIDWLVKEQEVTIDDKSKAESEFELNGRTWSRISWDAKDDTYGAAVVGFLFTPVGQGKLLTVTYWIIKKDFDKHMPTIEKILSSVKPVEE